MKQAASAKSIAGARADNTAWISSIRRQGGDGDVNRSRGWVRDEQNPSRKRDGACGWHRQETRRQHRLEARRWLRQSECGWHRQRAGSTAWTSAGSLAGILYVYSESTTTEGCHGTRPDEHNT